MLFTDIVESTEQLAELGDRRWRELLERHDALIRAELKRHGGREIKTTGDGFLATFEGPARAIECAQAIVAARDPSGSRSAPACTLASARWSGTTWRGWLCTSARGSAPWRGSGEVCVSGTVKDLVVGSGIEFSERGTRELKGVPGEWPIYRVEGAETPRSK